MRAATYFPKALRVLSRSRSAMSMASDADRHERQAARRCSAGDQRHRPRRTARVAVFPAPLPEDESGRMLIGQQ